MSKKTPGVIFDINYSTISVRPSIYQILSPILTFFRACLHGNGGRQVGEVTRLGGVTPCPYNLILNLITFKSVGKVAPRRVARYARPGNPINQVQILPRKHFKVG